MINSSKKGTLVRPAQVRKFCTIFVNAKIDNPDFDDQKKECMTTVKSKHGSKPILRIGSLLPYVYLRNGLVVSANIMYSP